MKSLPALSILALTAHVASKCPSGTLQGLNDQDCYHFEAVPAMWLKAEESCIKRKGHLTSVGNAMTNAMLRKISSLAGNKEFWLGGSSHTGNSRRWSWADGGRFSYKNWASGQPVNEAYYCTALDARGGRWHSRECYSAKPFICKVPAVHEAVATTTWYSSCPACPSDNCACSATSSSSALSTSPSQVTTTSRISTGTPTSEGCREGWTYVAAAAGKCLRITNSADTWSNTWAECKRLGGDLVSIPDNATNYAIRDYAGAGFGEGPEEGLGADFAIGLHKTTIDGTWQWTDGSPVTYTNWHDYYFYGPYANVTFLIVDKVSTYKSEWDARWMDDAEDKARAWQGICQSNRL